MGGVTDWLLLSSLSLRSGAAAHLHQDLFPSCVFFVFVFYPLAEMSLIVATEQLLKICHPRTHHWARLKDTSRPIPGGTAAMFEGRSEPLETERAAARQIISV